MNRLERLADFLEGVNEWLGRAVSWLTFKMVLVTFLIVILRYLFDLGWVAMQELVTYMHAQVFMLGAAYTLKHDGHVRVDIFYRKLGLKGRAWVDLGGDLLFLLPVMGFILWVSWDYVSTSWSMLEGSGEVGGIPAVFLLKSFIPLMAALMMLQGVSRAARSLTVLLGSTSPRQAATEVAG